MKHEIKMVCTTEVHDSEDVEKLWYQSDERLEECKVSYAEVMRSNHYRCVDEDSWFEAYYYMNEMEYHRMEAYEKAKFNQALLECRESLKDAEAVAISAGVEVNLGSIGKEWLLDTINNYFNSDRWIIPYYFIYSVADYDDEEESDEGGVKKYEKFFGEVMDEQKAFVKEYEKLSGDGRGPFAKLLGWYVNYFMERVPAWAASLTDNEKYRFIAELMLKAGVLERYRRDWVKNKWENMWPADKARQVRHWMEAAKKSPKD